MVDWLMGWRGALGVMRDAILCGGAEELGSEGEEEHGGRCVGVFRNRVVKSVQTRYDKQKEPSKILDRIDRINRMCWIRLIKPNINHPFSQIFLEKLFIRAVP